MIGIFNRFFFVICVYEAAGSTIDVSPEAEAKRQDFFILAQRRPACEETSETIHFSDQTWIQRK